MYSSSKRLIGLIPWLAIVGYCYFSTSASGELSFNKSLNEDGPSTELYTKSLSVKEDVEKPRIGPVFLEWDFTKKDRLLLGEVEIIPRSPKLLQKGGTLQFMLDSPFSDSGTVRFMDVDGNELVTGTLNDGVVDVNFQEFSNREFRYCIIEKKKSSAYSFCSPTLFVDANGTFKFNSNASKKSSVRAGERQLKLFGEKKVESAREDFNFIFQDGHSLTLSVNPDGIYLEEVYKGSNGIKISGWGMRPKGEVVVLENPSEDFWASTMGKTVKKSRWSTVLKQNAKRVEFFNEVGVPLYQKLYLNRIPSQNEPIRVMPFPEETYAESISIEGVLRPGMSILSQDGSIIFKNEDESTREGERRFSWALPLEKLGQPKTYSLNVQTPRGKWSQTAEIYRGYSTELSARLSLFQSSTGVLVFSNVKARTWFETILGSKSYLLSRQRWGLFGRHSQLLNAESEINKPLSLETFGVKYRTHQGVVNWNETWGIALGTQVVNSDNESASFFGGGIFWERSLPRFFAGLFDLVPWFRYPKWVSAEINAFPLPLGNGSGSTLVANFEGKIFWLPNFFGEAGFGWRNISLDLETATREVNTYFITGGIGWQF